MNAQIPALEDFVSVPDLAREIDVSRQRAHQIVKNSEHFPGARTIGAVIVVPKVEVERYKRLFPKKIAE